MSRHLLPPKPKTNPEQSTLTPETRVSMITTEEKCKATHLNASMGSSPTTSPSDSQCMKGVVHSPQYSITMPCSPMNNASRRTTVTGNVLNRPLQLELERSPEVNERTTSPPTQNLLERMGLGSRTLMMRLGLPLRAWPSPTQTPSSPTPGQLPKEAY